MSNNRQKILDNLTELRSLAISTYILLNEENQEGKQFQKEINIKKGEFAMNKKQLAKKLINNENIQPFFPKWEEFAEENIVPNNLEEYITANKKYYNDLILYKFACGEHKGVIKQYVISKIKMILNYNSINQYDQALLYILTDLLNKYFSIMPTEHRQGVLNNKQVNYSWNKVMQYNLIDPTKDKNYNYFQLQITVKDWINHAINGEKTLNKFTVDPLNRIYLNEEITA